MEPQFEVRTYLKKSQLVAFYRHIMKKRIIFWAIIYGILSVLSLWRGIGYDSIVWTLYGIFCIGYGTYLCLRPRILASKAIKKEKAFLGTDEILTVTTFGDVIFEKEQMNTATIPYDKLESIWINDDTIVLKGPRVFLLMDKNGFTKGTFQEFLPFIQEKCPQLNLPKW